MKLSGDLLVHVSGCTPEACDEQCPSLTSSGWKPATSRLRSEPVALPALVSEVTLMQRPDGRWFVMARVQIGIASGSFVMQLSLQQARMAGLIERSE